MSPNQTYAILCDWQLYLVFIGNNYYDGRYSNYQYKGYRVIAQTEEQAKQIVLANADYVLERLLTVRYNSKRKLLSKNKALKITEQRIGNVRLDTGLIWTTNYINLLSPLGLVKVKVDDYKIKDIIFSEDAADVTAI